MANPETLGTQDTKSQHNTTHKRTLLTYLMLSFIWGFNNFVAIYIF